MAVRRRARVFSMKMPWAVKVLAPLGILAFAVGGCGSRMSPPEKPGMSNTACMSMADTLKTLREGDELPRVVQVLGQPKRAFRVIAPFGSAYDVVEYEVGDSPCAKFVLNAGKKKLQVVFDDHGKLVGFGKSWYRKMQAATLVRVKGVPVDLQQFEEQ